MIRSPKFIAAAVVAVLVAAFLAFGVFGIHTAFVDEEVSEDNPFAVTTGAAAAPDEPAAEEEAPAEVTASPDAAETAAAPAAAPEVDAAAGDAPETDQAEPVSEPEVELEPTAVPEPATPQIITLGTGMLVNHEHQGTGTATVLTNGTQTFLRFEDDFAIDNGPDLNVYLSRGVDANGDPGTFDDDFIDLGDLKGNVGAQNYEVPAGVEIAEYNTVVIWCVRFGVAFNAANLT